MGLKKVRTSFAMRVDVHFCLKTGSGPNTNMVSPVINALMKHQMPTKTDFESVRNKSTSPALEKNVICLATTGTSLDELFANQAFF